MPRTELAWSNEANRSELIRIPPKIVLLEFSYFKLYIK